MITYNIYKDDELQISFEHQETDLKPFAWMLNNQGNSIQHAIKYEGWKVEEINESTKIKKYWSYDWK